MTTKAHRHFTFGSSEEPFVCDSGQTLAGVTIAYETWGTLNEARDNAILLLTGFSADSHVAKHTDHDRAGWWETMVGPGKSFDTDRWYIVCSNVIGGCNGSTGPASIDPSTGRPHASNFPDITIRDMVRGQRRLIDHLGIKSLASVAGASLGGQQALEWLATYPEMVRSALPIACSAKLTAQALAISEVSRAAIVADPNFHGGEYYDGAPPSSGIAVARMAAHLTYVSAESLELEHGRRTGTRARYSVQEHIRDEGITFSKRFDANTFLTLSWALEEFDLAHREGTLAAAFANVRVPVLLISFSTDWLFPTYQLTEIADALAQVGAPVTHIDVETPFGHDAFLTDWQKIAPLVSEFLNGIG